LTDKRDCSSMNACILPLLALRPTSLHGITLPIPYPRMINSVQPTPNLTSTLPRPPEHLPRWELHLWQQYTTYRSRARCPLRSSDGKHPKASERSWQSPASRSWSRCPWFSCQGWSDTAAGSGIWVAGVRPCRYAARKRRESEGSTWIWVCTAPSLLNVIAVPVGSSWISRLQWCCSKGRWG